jgi:hypothetical protein
MNRGIGVLCTIRTRPTAIAKLIRSRKHTDNDSIMVTAVSNTKANRRKGGRSNC